MAIRDRTFGSVLKQFANSVDVVDDQTFGRVGDQIKRYVAKQLDINFFKFQVVTQFDDDEVGLIAVWASEGGEGQAARPRTIFSNGDDETSYRNQSAYAFHTGKPLWIVNGDRNPLYVDGNFIDYWSGSKDVPRYRKPIERDLKTSIIVPVRHDDDVIGVINLESDEYIEATEVAKRELRLLADAIAELYLARGETAHQQQKTRRAIGDLREILESGGLPTLTKPHIFIASSGRADKAVMAGVDKVLDKFSDQLVPVLWSKSNLSGNINQQVLNDISKSRFGLCYFSEPTGRRQPQVFRDNSNVIFEAGMLHSLTNAPTDHPTGWIPIREANSPTMPFDFAHERTVIVPRDDEGRLEAEPFEEELERRIRGVLGEKPG